MKITFKSVLIGLAAILGIVGFCMAFLTPLCLAQGLDTGIVNILNQLGFNNGEVPFKEFYFGTENYDGHILGFIGFILMLVGAIAAIAIAFLSKKKKVYLWVLILGIITAAMFAVGGILALCVKAEYINTLLENPLFKAIILLSSKEAVTEQLNKFITLGTGPMVGGILGLAAAAVTIIACLLPGPKAKKAKK